jgi:transcriptional regulator with XRE-family HTH domain
MNESKELSPHHIKNRLWAARKAVNLSQKQVAQLLGHGSASQISRWEKGKRLPNTKDLLRLSAIYHRLANDLLWELFEELREEIVNRKKQLK